MHVRRTIFCLATIFFWAAHDPDVASGQSAELMEAYNTPNTLYEQGRYSEAEPYAKEALRLGTEEFGPNDPFTAGLLNELALLYQAQGRYAEAEPLFQSALAIKEMALGPDHPAVATSLENYAALLRETARADETKLEARAKAIRAKHAEPALAGSWRHDGWSLTLYAGRLSTSDSSDIFAADGEFDDAGAVGVALSKVLFTSWKHLVWEAEVQANQHVGGQDHVELDALILARWTSFPWNDVVRTSFAIGDGLSYATKTPKLERAAHGESAANLLNYVIGEITLAPPSNEHVSLSIRYQHRSGMFGTFSGVGEASTIFAFGMKYHF